MWKLIKIDGAITRSRLEKYQTVKNSSVLLIIIVYITKSDYEAGEYWKNKTKIAFPSQYSMSFSGNIDENIYILVSNNIHEDNSIDIGH